MPDEIGLLIPARLKSSRLPGKPLIDILGKSMIRRTWERCCLTMPKEKIFIATDSDLIASHVEEFGANAVLTSDKCLTGTDRLAEANEKLNFDVVINVQGDEPIINPEVIKSVIDYARRTDIDVVNAMSEIKDEKEFRSATIPKVVFSENMKLLYMSRAPIPGNKEEAFVAGYKQVCVYAFSKQALQTFAAVSEKSRFEAVEDIEILRFLELGYQVDMIEVFGDSIAVDVPEDVEKVAHILGQAAI